MPKSCEVDETVCEVLSDVIELKKIDSKLIIIYNKTNNKMAGVDIGLIIYFALWYLGKYL